ncbi:MAG: ubiquinol-cytochrome C reductase [Caulobacteraceae bacterium]|nr:ubiquinol-cytochrome C reductase [Caulobacteraceae bacterium]
MLEHLIAPRPAKTAGRRLYAAAVRQARSPGIYAALGAPDTPDGRFEIYTYHLLLLLERLKGGGREAAAASQAAFDAYISGLDHGLRELAVGDLSVGKAMRRLGEAFYGRAKAWSSAVEALPDRGPMEELIARTVLSGVADPRPAPLADYLLEARRKLAATSLERLLEGEPDWPV